MQFQILIILKILMKKTLLYTPMKLLVLNLHRTKKIYSDSKLVVIPLKETYQLSVKVLLAGNVNGYTCFDHGNKRIWDPYNFKDIKIYFCTKTK